MDKQNHRVVHLPVYSENAYQPMLMQAQRSLGWEVIDGGGGGNFLRTALRKWRPDILHLHWLHPYLLRAGRTKSWLRSWRFLCEIAAIRRFSPTSIVWTVHNLTNHDQRYSELELKFTRRFVRLCDLVLTHGEYAAAAARERFRIPDSIPVLSTRFPNYCDQYQSNVTRCEARQRWNVGPDEFVIGFLGRVEPYKQVVELVQAFRRVAVANQRLLIGGRAASDAYAQQVTAAIDDDPRIQFFNDYIPSDDVASFLLTADIVACPSAQILTSSSVALAMSFGRAVIAPAEGCIPEEVGDAGFLYDNTHSGLDAALAKAFQHRSQLSILGEQALQRARAASPDQIAQQIISGYQSVLRSQQPNPN